MHLKLISCNVFQREACLCVGDSPHVVDVEFTELGEHVHSASLRQLIQGKIDTADATGKYDAILVLFGLCGNAAVGLRAGSTQLVLPRAHDCCTILLGSRQAFKEHFQAAPSTPFSSSGYMERGDYFLRTDDGVSSVQYGSAFEEYVKQYGEENAKYIWEQMHPPAEQDLRTAVFIDLPQTRQLGFAEQFEQKARAAGKEVKRLDGDIRLIRGLIHGQWNPEDFLIVPPGQKTVGVYDYETVIRAEER